MATTNLPEIAYKVKSTDFVRLIKNHSIKLAKKLNAVSNVAGSENILSTDLELIGIKFEFVRKNNSGDVIPLENIRISQLYYNKINFGFLTYHPKLIDSDSLTDGYLTHKHACRLQATFSTSNTPEIIKHSLMSETLEEENTNATIVTAQDLTDEKVDLESIDNAFTVPISNSDLESKEMVFRHPIYRYLSKLGFSNNPGEEYYRPKVGFVYFSIGDFSFFCENFDYLIISGCKIELGPKLTNFQTEIENGLDSLKKDENDLYSTSNFTLKIEGDNAPSGSVYKGMNVDDDTSADGAGFTIGMPCPPEWYNRLNIYQQISQLDSQANLLKISESWARVYNMTEQVIQGTIQIEKTGDAEKEIGVGGM